MLDEVLKELRTGIEKAIEALRRDLSKVRTGRAHAGMLDSLRIDYYGVPTPVNQMANVSVPEPRLITIKPWEKGQVKPSRRPSGRATSASTRRPTASSSASQSPPSPRSGGREMVKLTKKHGEECKVAVRKHRRDANEMIESLDKDGDVSGDDADRALKKVEEIVADGIKQVDHVIAAKEKDILEV